ncbi:tetratricopeptide repeat protein [Candidatus Dependentiae bacterium]|nr:tetratricopeptide repeat protein [Candidatus Dependentiae bacterium]
MKQTKKIVQQQAKPQLVHEELFKPSAVTRLQITLSLLALTFFPFLFYYPSLHYDFQFDDIINIQRYFNIRHMGFSDLFLAYVRWISAWINTLHYKIGKFDPFSYRLFNVASHTFTGILVFFFVFYALSLIKRRTFFSENRFAIAFCTGALFVLHPVQTQTVSYVIQGQLEGLATLFTVAICITFLALANAKRFFAKAFLFLFLLTLGLLSSGTKEIAIVSPLLTLLCDWFFVAQGNWQSFKSRIWIHTSLMFVVWGIYLYYLKPSFFTNAIGLKMQARNNIGNILTQNQSDPIKPLHFFISQFKVITHYIVMFVWPFDISVEYDWKLVSSFFAPDCILFFLLLSGCAVAIGRLLYRDRTSIIAFAALWFAIAIAPRSSIIPSSELLVDYKTYLASFAVLFLLACVLVKLNQLILDALQKKSPTFSHPAINYLFALLLCLPLGYMTTERNKVWRSGEDFWTNIIKNAPMKARAYNNLGVAISEQGRMAESIPLYKKAIDMDRNYPDPWNNLAVAYSATNKIDLAIETMKQALNIHRNYPEGYNNLASFFIAKKDYENAEKMLQVALQLRPYYGKAYFNYGKMYMDQGKYDQALQSFRDACTKGDLDNVAGFTVLASMAMAMQKYQDGILAYQKLLEFDPTSYDHTFNLAYAYTMNQQYPEAIQIYRFLVNRNVNDGRSWYNMGECYVRIKDLQSALDSFQMAKRLNFQMANLELRIAACLHDLGKQAEARDVLVAYVQKDGIPADLKNSAHAILAELNRRLTAQPQAANA